ncbi:glycosyltransferase [Raoultella ornithinolytica]|uniref:glycosyltransferase n=1 Tax=Raoultella ornithinolytica TaxID=54291 RepID=UPI002FF00ECE|nr:glycosyltransferase [Raoultella ornithinolytica]
MRILIFNSLYYPFKVGGAEVSVKLLAESLVKKGHSVRVVSITNGTEKTKKIINGVESVSIPNCNIYWPFENHDKSILKKIVFHIKDIFNFEMQSEIKKELKDFKPEIAHTNNLFGLSCLTWLTCAREKIKIVHTTRDYYLLHINAGLYRNEKNINPLGLEVKIISSIKSIMSQNISAVVGISKYMSELHKINGFAKKSKHVCIYNTVEKIDYTLNPHEGIVVGFLGRLTKEKGFDVFCDFANKYKESSKSIQFIAAGPLDSLSEDLRGKAISSGVKLCGFLPLSDFLAKTDAVLLPTKWNEPFGRSVAELGLAGKLVFTNLTGGTKEIGNLFQSIYPLEAFDLELIENFKSPTIDDSVVHQFSSERICQEYEALYLRVLNYE